MHSKHRLNGMDGRHSGIGAFEARRGARQNQYYRGRRSKRFGSSPGSRHDRCDGAGRRAKPALERAGIFDTGGFEQGEFADPELRLRHERAEHTKEPATGGEFNESSHRRRSLFALAGAETQYNKNLAKVSSGY